MLLWILAKWQHSSPEMTLTRWAKTLLPALVICASTNTAIAGRICSSSEDLFLNPFSKFSAHHRPIGTGAMHASETDDTTKDWLLTTHFNVNAGTPWGTDVFETTDQDTMWTIEPKAYCDKVYGLPKEMKLPSNGVNP